MPQRNFDSDKVEMNMFDLLRKNDSVSEVEEAFDIIGPPKMLMLAHFDNALQARPSDSRLKTFIKAIADGDMHSKDYIDAVKAFMLVIGVRQGDVHYRHENFFSASKSLACTSEDYVVCTGDPDEQFAVEKQRYIRNGMYANGRVYMFEGFKDAETRDADQKTEGWLSYYSNIKDLQFSVYDPKKMARTIVNGSLFGEVYDETGTNAMVVEYNGRVFAVMDWAQYNKIGIMELRKKDNIGKRAGLKLYNDLMESFDNGGIETNDHYIKIAYGGKSVETSTLKPIVVIADRPGGGKYLFLTSNSHSWENFLEDTPISFCTESFTRENSVENGIYEIIDSSFERIIGSSYDD